MEPFSAHFTAVELEERWARARTVGWLVSSFLGASAAVTVATRIDRQLEPAALLAADVFTIGTTAWAVSTEWPALRTMLGRPRIERGEAARTLGFVAAAVVFISAYWWGLTRVLHLPELRYFEPWTRAGWSPAWAWLALCVIAPTVEELAFRGFVQTRLESLMPARDAAWIQAALFAVMHLSPWAFVSHLVLGLALGRLRTATRSLVPSVLGHALWNAGVLVAELRATT